MDYDTLTIVKLESMVIEKNEASLSSKKEMVETLIYLKTSKRFRENKVYAKASFDHYIFDRFNIRPKTFREMQKAFTRHPEETVHYGVGTVARIQRECGQKNAGNVLNEMRKTETAVKVLKYNKIDDIIKKYAKPRPEKKIITDWKSKYENEAMAHETTKKQFIAALIIAEGSGVNDANNKAILASLYNRAKEEFSGTPTNDQVLSRIAKQIIKSGQYEPWSRSGKNVSNLIKNNLKGKENQHHQTFNKAIK